MNSKQIIGPKVIPNRILNNSPIPPTQRPPRTPKLICIANIPITLPLMFSGTLCCKIAQIDSVVNPLKKCPISARGNMYIMFVESETKIMNNENMQAESKILIPK